MSVVEKREVEITEEERKLLNEHGATLTDTEDEWRALTAMMHNITFEDLGNIIIANPAEGEPLGIFFKETDKGLTLD